MKTMNEQQKEKEEIDECMVCHRLTTIIDCRGRKRCIKCHLNFIWDFIEENRRRLPVDEKKDLLIT